MEGKSSLITVIGMNHLWSITALLEQLSSRESVPPNQVQTNPLENGYSTGVITITVLLVESMLNRIWYFEGDKSKLKPIDFFKTILAKLCLQPEQQDQLANEFTELVMIRDAIVHNHISTVEHSWSSESGMLLNTIKLFEGSGDKKFSKWKSDSFPTSSKSDLLRLNLNPIRIWRSDVAKVLKTAVQILLLLEKEDPCCNVSNQYVSFDGDLLPFVEIVQNATTKWITDD